MRMRGEPITDRLVSIFDPDARPIRKGKLGKPNEFGYVAQICEVTENTKRGARGLILPAASQIGNPHEDTLLPRHRRASSSDCGLRPREVALDGGFKPGPTRDTLHNLEPDGRSSPAASNPAPGARSDAWLATAPAPRAGSATSNAATGCAAARLKDHHGEQTWTAWGILAYNLDTLAVRTS